MKVRDGHATINGDETEHELPSGCVEIIADDGRTLLSVTVTRDNEIRIHAGHHCKHGGKVLDDKMYVVPVASNCIQIIRPEYK